MKKLKKHRPRDAAEQMKMNNFLSIFVQTNEMKDEGARNEEGHVVKLTLPWLFVSSLSNRRQQHETKRKKQQISFSPLQEQTRKEQRKDDTRMPQFFWFLVWRNTLWV